MSDLLAEVVPSPCVDKNEMLAVVYEEGVDGGIRRNFAIGPVEQSGGLLGSDVAIHLRKRKGQGPI
jgi:hypothetical protein